MNPSKALNMQEVVGTFLFANVPAYLYDTYRQSDCVRAFAHDYSSSEIIKAFEDTIKIEPRKGEDTALLYCLIAALSLKNFSEVRQFFESLDHVDLKWASDMKRLFLRYTTPDFEDEIGHGYITEIK